MKRVYLSIVALCVWALCLHAQNGEFDPTNPGDPMPYYALTVHVSPSAGGTANITRTMAAEGQEVALRITPAKDFKLSQWVCGDSVLGTETYQYFTMPARNVVITAQMVYEPEAFNPPSPEDPQGQGEVIRKHQVTVYTSPSVGGSVNCSSFYMAEGAQERIYAYPNAGYEFVGWQQNGILFSNRNPLLVEMAERDLDYTAVFSFNPVSPADPNANSWDSSTGTLLVDRFTAGRLSSTISNLLGDNSYTYVQSVTIIGQITDGDIGVFQNMSSCGHIDISRTNGISTIPQWAFANLTSLHTLILPASVELIEENVFYGSTAIGELVLCAAVPPDVEDNALDDLASTITVRVPASALNLYRQSPLWSRFNLVAMDAQTLTVALPQDAQDGRYKNTSLELVNLQSGQTQHYLITDRTEYTFLNLFQNSNYSLSVKNSRGMVLGTIDNIIIEDQDLSLAFDSFLMPQTLTLKIVTPEGGDITSSAAITWLDDKGNYLQKGAVLTNVIEGVEVYYTIDLEAKYNSIYEELPKESVVVNSEQKVKEIQLTKRQSIILSGKVVSSTSLSPVKGVYVSIAQSLKGKNSNVYFAETDNEGNFSVEVLNANTTLYFTENSYLKHTLIVDTTQLGDLGTIKIQPLTGTVLYVIPQYTESVLQGNEQEVTDYYADYANVDFSVYNVTQQKSMQAVVKYPLLTLPEKIALGDSLAVTATSRNHKFYPSTIGTRIDSSLYARVNIPITQLGAIYATYQQADVDEVAALLFDNQGNLVQKKIFNGSQEVTFDYLDDGNYTVVCLENLRPFSGISRLSEFSTSPLIAGNDYLQNTITVSQGWISGTQFDSISAIDRALLYGGTNMRFTSSSTQVIVGNYVTLKAQIDFKHNSLNDISDVRLVFDLPENTEFVNGSVMVGGKVCNNYTLSNGRLIVPIQNTNQQIAFCITPLQEGIYTPCAYAQFKVSNADLQIPIASTYYEVKGLTLNVPNVSASKTIIAGGTAIPNSTVEVYADDELIGTAQSLGNGSWSADCTFNNPANLSIMKVYASAVDKNGVKHVSETYNCQYNQDAIEVSKVTMTNTAHGSRDLTLLDYVTVFDFMNPNHKNKAYWYWPSYPLFTFDIDFTINDTTKISDVVLYVKTSDGNWTSLPANYDATKEKWVASGDFNTSYALPANVAVDFQQKIEYLVDDNAIDNKMSDYNILIEDYLNYNRRISDYSDMVDAEISSNNVNYDVVDSLMVLIDNSIISQDYQQEDSLHNLTDEAFWNYYGQLQIKLTEDIKYHKNLLDTIDNVVQNNWSLYGIDTLYLYEAGFKMIVSIKPTSMSQKIDLLLNGFQAIPTTNGDTLYEYVSDVGYQCVDFARNFYLSIEYVLDERQNAPRRYTEDNSNASQSTNQFMEPINNALGSLSLLGEPSAEYSTEAIDVDINNAEAAYKEAVARGASKNELKSIVQQRRDLKIAKGKVGNFGKLCKGAGYFSTLGNSLKLRSDFMALQEELGRVPYPPCMSEIEAAQWESNLAYLQNKIMWGYTNRTLRDAGEELLNTVLSECVGNLAGAAAGTGTAAGVTAGTGGVGVGVGVVAGVAVGTATRIGATALTRLAATAVMNGINNFFDDRYFAEMRAEIDHINNFAAQKGQSCNNDKLNDPKGKESGNKDVTHTLDPAGFVYEAVEENRVEGVTATIYYKDTVRNEFGEVAEAEIVWDASEFDQENPLYTDANGEYQWFVPQGLWQVRFEKEGYEPTQSEWLPVPPPQLEVNIPIVQLRQPEVTNAIAHKDAIDISFDKYMMPSLLNTDNIFVTANDQTIAGTIVMLDEQHPYDNTETSYAMKVRFVPAAPFTASEITLTVSTRVHSYADVPLAQTFQQTFDVEDATVIEPAQTPVASIASGTEVELGTQVTLSCATEGAVIRYTMDGSEPDCKTGYVYSAPIVLYGNGSVTVKAIACAEGYDPSEVAQWTYSFPGMTTAAEEVETGLPQVSKLLRDGQLFILRGDKTYTVTGQEVR